MSSPSPSPPSSHHHPSTTSSTTLAFDSNACCSNSPASSPSDVHPSPPSFTQQYIKAWSSFTLPVVLHAGDTLYYEYRTEAHDIQFRAIFSPAETRSMCHAPDDIMIQKLERIANPDQVLQYGKYTNTTQNDGTLKLHWDNTYSKLRGKNLLYRTVLIRKGEADRFSILLGEEMIHPTLGRLTLEGVRSDGIYLVAMQYGYGYINDATMKQSVRSSPQKSENERCMIGVQLFMNNRVWESENFFRGEVDKYPVFSLAYGSLGFLRALMTWQKEDIAEANTRLKQTRHFVSALLPQTSTVKSVSKFLTRTIEPVLTTEQMSYTLLQAETYLLQAILLFTEESYMTYIKAGLKIRSAWKLYQTCQRTLDSMDVTQRAQVDPSVLGGIKFGIGCFNVIISILPSIILRIVSALGFPSNRKHGLKLLKECSQVRNVRQPLSCLMLLFVYIIIPSFYTVRPNYHITQAKEILRECFEQNPCGALWLWMEGRWFRMRRNLTQATLSFRKSAHAQPAWKQLQHLCMYELGWCSFFDMQYEESRRCWEGLEKDNTWSRAFFLYMEGICAVKCEMNAPSTSTSSSSSSSILSSSSTCASPPLSPRVLFSRISDSIQRKFGGKMLSIESFVLARANMILSGSDNKKTINVSPYLQLEMSYLFYGFIQMSDALLLQALQEVDAILTSSSSSTSTLTFDDFTLCRLFKAGILKGLRRWSEAKTLLLDLNKITEEQIQYEPNRYVIPFIRFELGSLLLEQVMEKDQAVEKGGSGECSIDKEIAAGDGAGGNAEPSGSSSSRPRGSSLSVSASRPRGNSNSTQQQQQQQQSTTAASSAAVASSCSSSSSSTAAALRWQQLRGHYLTEAHDVLKRCESMKTDYPFKNRLHLRIHLALVELKLMKKNWSEDDVEEVRDESELNSSPHEHDNTFAGQKIVDSDEENDE